MDLFVINRYEGDEPKKTNEPYDHLGELKRKIEERKKQRAAAAESKSSEPVVSKSPENESKENKSDATTKSRRKNRKRKHEPSDDSGNVKSSNTLSGEGNDTASGETLPESSAANTQFTILGNAAHKKRKSVKRVLPKWLAHPEIISADLSSGSALNELDKQLEPRLIETLKSNGIERVFPVQQKLISWMAKCNKERQMGWRPRDTCVSAPTGSGKTLAYVLPIIQHLQNRFIREIRCLIVLPVQELAAQVYKVLTTYSAHTDLRIGLISGATTLETERFQLIKKTQRGEIVSRVDIVVATPGHLIDHIEKTEGFSLDNLEFLVIDEADRSTEWIKYLPACHRGAPVLTIHNIKSSAVVPAQKLLFSATLSQDPEKISRLGLFQPILFTSVLITGRDDDVNLDKEVGEYVGRYISPTELTERVMECSPEYKPLAVVKLLTSEELFDKALVFTNSGEAAHRFAILLQSLLKEFNIIVDELSAQLTPKQRSEVLKTFAADRSQVLISSDALARGIDIPGVKLVISYDLPKHVKGYIHRAGRTGRAGLPGTAISIVTPNQVGMLSNMLKAGHKTLPQIERIDDIETLAETINYASHLDYLRSKMTT